MSSFDFIASWEVWGREKLLERLDEHHDVLHVFFYPIWKSLELRFRTDQLELVQYGVAKGCGWRTADSHSLYCFQRKGANSDLVFDIVVRSCGSVQSLLRSIRLQTRDVRRHLRGIPGEGLLWSQRTYAISLKGGTPGVRVTRLDPPLTIDAGKHQRFKVRLTSSGYAWTGYVRLTLLYGRKSELPLPWTFLAA